MERSGQSDPRQEFASRADKEVQILKDAQGPEVRRQTNQQETATSDGAGCVFKLDADEVIHTGGTEENKGEPPTGRQRIPLLCHQVREKSNWIAYKKAGIKNIATGEQERLSSRIGPKSPSDGKNDRKEKAKMKL